MPVVVVDRVLEAICEPPRILAGEMELLVDGTRPYVRWFGAAGAGDGATLPAVDRELAACGLLTPSTPSTSASDLP